MNNAQKVIKYVAIAFAIGLIAAIISTILTGVFAFAGINTLIDVVTDSVETIDVSKDFKNIHSIELDISSAELEIVKADKLKVEGKAIPVDYEFKEENGELKIKNKKVAKNAKLVIYLPAEIKDLDIDIGAGKIQMEDLTIQEISLDTGASTVDINKLTVTSKMDVDAGVGDLVIIDSDVSNLDLDAGVGNVKYTGYLKGNSEINCGVGNMELNLQGTLDIYKLIAERGIGQLRVNDLNLSGTQTLGTGSNIVKLSGGIGSLKVTY